MIFTFVLELISYYKSLRKVNIEYGAKDKEDIQYSKK